MVNLNHLRIFYHVAKNLSFTVAARDLFITQPAVTNQVKAFEDSLELRLFRKKGNKVYLTNDGKNLYEKVKKVFEYEKEIEATIKEMIESRQSVLRFGTSRTFAQEFNVYLVSSFKKNYPDIRLQVSEGSSLDMTQSILNLENDVAVVAKVMDHPELRFTPFMEEELVFIVGPKHPFSKKKALSFHDISKEPFILKGKGSGTRRRIDKFFNTHECAPNILLETSNTEFIKRLVQDEEGCSILANAAVAYELREGKLLKVPLEGFREFLPVYIVSRKDLHLSEPVKALFEISEKWSQNASLRGDSLI